MGTPYQQTGDYIPKTDGGFRDWLNNFATLISQNPGRYGLGQSDANVIANLNEQFGELYTLCQSTATRTTGLVTQKDAVRASAKSTCRVYARQIKANEGVDNQDKIQLGLHLSDPTPTPIPAPDSAPVLSIIAAFSGEHVLRYADENTPGSRAKPAGATQMELYVHVGPQKATSYKDAQYVGVYTRQPIKYSFEPEDAGQVATYYARWRTARGLAGPFSLGSSMMIAFDAEEATGTPGTTDGGTPGSTTSTTSGTDSGDDDLKIAA